MDDWKDTLATGTALFLGFGFVLVCIGLAMALVCFGLSFLEGY